MIPRELREVRILDGWRTEQRIFAVDALVAGIGRGVERGRRLQRRAVGNELHVLRVVDVFDLPVLDVKPLVADVESLVAHMQFEVFTQGRNLFAARDAGLRALAHLYEDCLLQVG